MSDVSERAGAIDLDYIKVAWWRSSKRDGGLQLTARSALCDKYPEVGGSLVASLGAASLSG